MYASSGGDVLMFPISFPPLAMAEWGFAGELGLDPTMYGTLLNQQVSHTKYEKVVKYSIPDIGLFPRK
jgi:hypothetical protein